MADIADITIRNASAEDAEEIARLKKLVWENEKSQAAKIARAIQDSSHASAIALVDEHVIGFVDGFTTSSADNTLRWEVDLLAVHPRFRNQGWGEKLVRRNLEEGKRHLAQFARSLIQVENHASQQVFIRCGFKVQEEICGLYISNDGIEGSRPADKKPHLITVHTFNYSGAWLELPFDEHDAITAQSMQNREGWDVLGTVIPLKNKQLTQSVIKIGYRYIGNYQWWMMDF